MPKVNVISRDYYNYKHCLVVVEVSWQNEPYNPSQPVGFKRLESAGIQIAIPDGGSTEWVLPQYDYSNDTIRLYAFDSSNNPIEMSTGQNITASWRYMLCFAPTIQR